MCFTLVFMQKEISQTSKILNFIAFLLFQTKMIEFWLTLHCIAMTIEHFVVHKSISLRQSNLHHVQRWIFWSSLKKYLILSCFGFKCLKMVRLWDCLDVKQKLGHGPGGQVSSGLSILWSVGQMVQAIIMVIKCILCWKVIISRKSQKVYNPMCTISKDKLNGCQSRCSSIWALFNVDVL